MAIGRTFWVLATRHRHRATHKAGQLASRRKERRGTGTARGMEGHEAGRGMEKGGRERKGMGRRGGGQDEA